MKTFTIRVYTESGRFLDEQKRKASRESDALAAAMRSMEHLSGSENFSYAVKQKKGRQNDR